MTLKCFRIICFILSFFLCATALFAQTDASGSGEEKAPTENSENNAADASKDNNTSTDTTTNKKGAYSSGKKAAKVDPKEVEEKKVKWIKETIKFGIQSERRDAVNMIPAIKDEANRNALCDIIIETLKDEHNGEVAIKILNVLSELKIKRAETQIIEKLSDDSEDILMAAIYAIKSIEAVAAKDKLISKFKDQKLDVDSRLVEPLLSTLGSFKAVELVPYIQENIKGNTATSAAREHMVLFLSNIDSPESKTVLKELYIDEEEEVMIRSFAVNGLAKLNATENTVDINNVLNSIEAYPFKKKQRYHNLVIYSIAALVKLGDEQAVPRLIDFLKSDNTAVRLKAIELIKETGDKRTIDILKYKMKYDSDARVKKAAENALKSMGEEIE